MFVKTKYINEQNFELKYQVFEKATKQDKRVLKYFPESSVNSNTKLIKI